MGDTVMLGDVPVGETVGLLGGFYDPEDSEILCGTGRLGAVDESPGAGPFSVGGAREIFPLHQDGAAGGALLSPRESFPNGVSYLFPDHSVS